MAQNQTNALQVKSAAELAEGTAFDPRDVELIRSQIAPGATPEELMLFLKVASSRGLDPFRKHIYAVSRWDSSKKRMAVAHQVSIDGLRLIAERTGKYEGQIGPVWCGQDGIWVDIWLPSTPPAAAKVGVFKTGFREPLFATAKFTTYVQTTKEGNPTKFWKDMPEVMIAKVAEAAALRRAFPEETGGLYTGDEMDQADAIEATAHVAHTPQPTPLDALQAWAGDIGLGAEDLDNAASYFLKQHITVDEMKTADISRTLEKLQHAHGKDATSFFAWIKSLRSQPEPIDAEHRPADDDTAAMDAALANATPASLPLDVPDDRYTQ